MLLELKIENFALVEDMEMVFNPGFNILTGESGSGKSLIVESLNFVLGARVKSSRFDSDETVRVQAVFDISGLEQELLDQLKNYDITGEADQVLVLNRKLYSSGRSVYQINGEIVPYSNFKEIGFQLVDIHGQRDNQYLFDLNNQRKLVDLAAGKEAKVLLERIQQIYSEYKNLEREIQVLKEQEKDRNRRIDWLEHEINEIASAQLVVGEDEELEQTRKILSNREKIAELCNSIHEKLSSESGVIEKLNRVSRELEQLVSLDTSLDISSDLIDVALNNIQEIIFTVRDKAESLETGGANLDEVISRLNLIDNLKKKYGNSIEEILGYLEESRKKLETLSRSQQVIEDLLGRKTEQEKEWLWTAESLSVLRKKAAKKIQSAVVRELAQLEMKDSRFTINLQREGNKPRGKETTLTINRHGLDNVEFYIGLNPGTEEKPLALIVSGGELSRIMLALKAVFARFRNFSTLVLDEVDVGLGGNTAKKVGEKLKEISLHRQVICVTHLPVIAAMGRAHYNIQKVVEEGKTYSKLIKLEGAPRVDELAKMIAGHSASDATREAAEKLLKGK